jgi:hypothetical protein
MVSWIMELRRTGLDALLGGVSFSWLADLLIVGVSMYLDAVSGAYRACSDALAILSMRDTWYKEILRDGFFAGSACG